MRRLTVKTHPGASRLFLQKEFFYVYLYLCVCGCRCPKMAERASDPPGTVVIGSCELSSVCAGNQALVLCEGSKHS